MGEVAHSSQCPRPCRQQEAVWFCLPSGPQVSTIDYPLQIPLAMSEGWGGFLVLGRRVTLPWANCFNHVGSCRVCDEPSSEDPHEWPEDITKWPVSWGLILVKWGRRPHRSINGAVVSHCWVTRIFTLPLSSLSNKACL